MSLHDKKRVLATQPPRDPAKPTFQVLPVPLMDMNGQQTIAASGTFEFEVTGPVQVLSYHIDIPPDCDATLEVDGKVIMGSADEQGLVGSLVVGDLAAGVFQNVGKIVFSGTNNSASAQDVRAWIVAVYG